MNQPTREEITQKLERVLDGRLQEISNTDSVIQDINIQDSSLMVHILLWNEETKRLKFNNYLMFKEQRSIGEEIGDIKIQTKSVMLDELRQNILNGGGTLDEIADVKSIMFYNAWNETVLLEVLAENIEFE